MEDYKVVNFTYYDPANSFFKSKASDKSHYTLYYCNCEKCEAREQGKCAMMGGLWGEKCPYGKRETIEGFTQRAKSYYSFLRNAKEKYGEFSYKLKNLEKLCEIGDYVYLPLAHLNNYVNPIIDQFNIKYEHFLLKNQFTSATIDALINYVPRALWQHEEIRDYQTKEVPEFVRQLKKKYPDKYKRQEELNPRIKDFVIDVDYVKLKKEAYLKTLNKGKVGFSIYTVDWDGEFLTGTARDFGIWLNGGGEVKIKPNDKTIVKIVDNNTVDEEKTVFVN